MKRIAGARDSISTGGRNWSSTGDTVAVNGSRTVMRDRAGYGRLLTIRLILVVLAVSILLDACAHVHCSTGGEGGGPGGCGYEQHFETY